MFLVLFAIWITGCGKIITCSFSCSWLFSISRIVNIPSAHINYLYSKNWGISNDTIYYILIPDHDLHRMPFHSDLLDAFFHRKNMFHFRQLRRSLDTRVSNANWDNFFLLKSLRRICCMASDRLLMCFVKLLIVMFSHQMWGWDILVPVRIPLVSALALPQDLQRLIWRRIPRVYCIFVTLTFVQGQKPTKRCTFSRKNEIFLLLIMNILQTCINISL